MQRADRLPPADLSALNTLDGRGRPIHDLYECTVPGRSGTAVTVRFGAEDEKDAQAGAEEFARALFAEVAQQYLELIPTARPHPDDTLVAITLRSTVSGETWEFEYLIPPEFQPNHKLTQPGVFYRF